MQCLFCDTGQSFTTKEHIIPESLGNNKYILYKEVCDSCQNYLSKIEGYVLSKTPIGFWRVLFNIRNKKNRLPSVDFNKPKRKGIHPDTSDYHDNVKFVSQLDDTMRIELESSLEKYMQNDTQGEFKYTITPKVIHEIGRFLGKIGLEFICYNNSSNARKEDLDAIRKYIRYGSVEELWPIYHATEGDIQSLFSYNKNKEEVEERIAFYSHLIFSVDCYLFFRLKIGTDIWLICLNQQFPHPKVFDNLRDKVSVMWYSKSQWKN